MTWNDVVSVVHSSSSFSFSLSMPVEVVTQYLVYGWMFSLLLPQPKLQCSQ